MAGVTGMLNFFDWGSIAPRHPVLRFHPRSERGGLSLRPERLLSHRPVDAVIDGVEWSVNLVPTTGLVPVTWYEVELIELGDQGEFTSSWWWPFKVFVGDEGGEFGDLPTGPISPDSVWVGLTAPPQGWPGYWLYSPAVGESMPLDDPDIGMLRRVSRG